jgi:hypothetical protein
MATASLARGRLMAFLLLAFAPACARSGAELSLDDPQSPLRLVRTIALPGVRGRIDHMTFDSEHDRLFVAEYGNGSVDEVDLASGTVHRITGLRDPQGIAWLAKQREVAVACGDGSLRFFRGVDLKEVARISLGDDADNIRLDARNGDLVVGFGSGGLAVVDPVTHQVVRKLDLKGHPEAFVLVGPRALVNVPDAHGITVADLDQARVITTVNTGMLAENYPMAVDGTGSRIAVGYRFPSALSVIDAASGGPVYSVPMCSDADDLFFHGGHIVVVCGEGVVGLTSEDGEHTRVRVGTARGARTGLLVSSHNSLFIAVPGQGDGGAIWQLAFR